MKNIVTLSAIAALAVGSAMAKGPVKRMVNYHSGVKTLEQVSEKSLANQMQFERGALLRVNDPKFKFIDMVEKSNFGLNDVAAEEGTTEGTEVTYESYPGYLLPAGGFYAHTILGVSQVVDGEKLTGEVFLNGSTRILLPAATQLTWPNYSLVMGSDESTSFGELGSWSYYEHYARPVDYYASLKTFDKPSLQSTTIPSYEEGFALPAPKLTVNGVTYQAQYSRISTSKTVGALSMFFGGSGAGNTAENKYYEKNAYEPQLGVSVDTTYTKSFLGNPFGKDAVNSNNYLLYSASMTCGSTSQIWSLTGDALLDDIYGEDLGNIRTQAGLAADAPFSLVGFGQYFTTSAQARLHSITLPCFADAAPEDEISIELYKVVASDNGNSLQNVATFAYVFEDSTTQTVEQNGSLYLNPTVVKVMAIDEEKGVEYLDLEGNTTYILMVTGLQNVDGFTPCVINNRRTTIGYTPELNNYLKYGSDMFTMFNNDEIGIVPIDAANVGWTSSAKTTFTETTSMSWMLELEYPYVSPNSYLNADMNFVEYDVTLDEIELPIVNLPISETSSLQCGYLVANSDMSADKLAASLEYSSETLKNKIKVYVEEEQGSTEKDQEGNALYVNTTTGRTVLVVPSEDIPAGSWIKLNNKFASLKVNLPEYTYSGVGTVVADTEVVATECFDLAGRKVAADAQGLMIQKVTMADGSVKAVKVVK